MAPSEDAWADIGIPSQGEGFRARRIDPDCPWDFYRARDSFGRYAILMRFAGNPPDGIKVPRLREISISLGGADADRGWFVLALEARENVELFERLCADIVESTKSADAEEAALRVAVNRTWRWHRLMQGGTSELLSREAQQGLIGELRFLCDVLMEVFPPEAALQAWEGPAGAPHDVAAGAAEVEIKTRRTNARQEIRISSEDQLEKAHGNTLFLWVADVGEAVNKADGQMSLRDLVERVRSITRAAGNNSEILLDRRLDDCGYVDRPEYDSPIWFFSQERCYAVRDDFPRLVPQILPKGVDKLSYSVSLDYCEQYKVSTNTLIAALTGNRDG